MDIVVGVIIGLLVLIFLVVVHELGHAIVARRNGVVVKEFGVGFPPKAYSKKVKRSFLGSNVEFSWNWLPLGGFVRLKGEYNSANKKGDYGAASYWAKTRILFAGVAVNWLVAAILLTVLAWIGLPKIIDNQFHIPSDTRMVVKSPSEITVVGIEDNSVAHKAGLRTGDDIKKINNSVMDTSSQVVETVKRQTADEMTITIERDGEERTVVANLEEFSKKNGEPKLGVSVSGRQASEAIYATWSAPIVGVGTTVQLTAVTLQGIGDMLVKITTGIVDKFSADDAVRKQGGEKINEVSQGVAGPVGILGVIFPQMSQAGFGAIIFLTAIISLSLAVMNILPIPALDGGRWLIMTIFKLRKEELTREKEENIQAVGMLVLLALMVVITVADIGKVLQ